MLEQSENITVKQLLELLLEGKTPEAEAELIKQYSNRLNLLQSAVKLIREDRRFFEQNSILEYIQNKIFEIKLQKKLKYCRQTREFAAVVKKNKQHINMIADLLLQDPIHLQLNFIQSDDPCFFELLKEFPEHFKQEVNKHLLRWQDEKPHAFHFDTHVENIIRQNNVGLINPSRISTEAQDPVFTHLVPETACLSAKESAKHLKTAIKNIIKDERFVYPGSTSLNQAGTALTRYAKKRLALLEKLIPSFKNAMNALFIHIKRAFLEVYGFHGFDYTEHHATTASDNGPYEGEKLSFILVLFSFLGLPTRPSHLDRCDSPLDNQFSISRTEQKPLYSPNLSLLQVARNFIGGWIPIREDGEWVWTEKKRWQIVALPFKIGIILPLNIIAIPFQFALNLIKIITELSPSLIVDAAKIAYNKLHKLAQIVYSNKKLGYLSIIPALLVGVAALAVKVIIIALNVFKKLGIAFSSPEKSAKMAFVYGRKFILGSRKKESVDDFAFAMGVFLAFVSILTSAILWSMFLPLAFGAIGTYVPAVVQVVNTVLNLPLISTFYAVTHAALLHLGLLLNTISTLGGTITSIAGWIGVQFSIEFMLVCSTFALLMTPLSAILARIVDDLSNQWHQWDSKTGLLSSFFAIFNRKNLCTDTSLKPLLGKMAPPPLKSPLDKTGVSADAQSRAASLNELVETAEDLERLNSVRADSAARESDFSSAARLPISPEPRQIETQLLLAKQNKH